MKITHTSTMKGTSGHWSWLGVTLKWIGAILGWSLLLLGTLMTGFFAGWVMLPIGLLKGVPIENVL